MENKEQVEKVLFDIEHIYLPRYLYKLNTHSMKVFNSFNDIEYMYRVINKVADKNNLNVNSNIQKLYKSSVSRDLADSDEDLRKDKWLYNHYASKQFNNCIRLYIILKDLLKVVENDFTMELNFYNNVYLSTKEDVD